MKLKHTLIIGSLLFSVTAFAQDKKAPVKETQEKGAAAPAEMKMTPEQQAEEKAWMAYMTPGEAHKRLMSAEGEWKEDLTFWMAPGAPPTKAESKCINKSVLGGRYIESIHTGDMMGMPFEGHGIIGYDNSLKKYQCTWIDNMGTGIMFLTGTYDPKTNSVMYSGKTVDPASGKEENVRQHIKFIDDKTQILEMFMTKNGKEFKNMEIKMTKM